MPNTRRRTRAELQAAIVRRLSPLPPCPAWLQEPERPCSPRCVGCAIARA